MTFKWKGVGLSLPTSVFPRKVQAKIRLGFPDHCSDYRMSGITMVSPAAFTYGGGAGMAWGCWVAENELDLLSPTFYDLAKYFPCSIKKTEGSEGEKSWFFDLHYSQNVKTSFPKLFT